MGKRMTPEQEARLNQFLFTAEKQNAKMDGLIAGINQLVPQVSDSKSDIRYLRSAVKKNEVGLARLEEKQGNMSEDIDNIGKKQRKHEGDISIHRNPGDAFTDATLRWGFLAKVAAGITAFTGLVTVLAKSMVGP